MATNYDEEQLLRSVAWQNAQTIRLVRRRAEEASRQQSEWLRVTLASIGDGVISTDADGRITFMNAVAESLTGWPQHDALGQPLDAAFRIIHEQTREHVENPVMRVLREGAIVGMADNTMLMARDGAERPIDDSAAPIRDEQGRLAGCVLVFRDVSQRRRAENDLRRSERELADFFENASIGLHGRDDRWSFTIWSRNLADEYYWTAVASNANVVVRFPSPPRTYGATFGFKF